MYAVDTTRQPPAPQPGGLSEEEVREIIARHLRTGQPQRSEVQPPQAPFRRDPMDLAMARQSRRRPPINEEAYNLRRQALMATTQGGSM